ncbi:MAG: arginase family protein [Candidatus Nanohaloarchaea archaeon]
MRTNSPEDAEVVLQKLPSDIGIHRNPRKGTLNAPEVILDGLEFEATVFVDEVFPDEFDLAETQRRIRDNTREVSDYETPVISVGGDHSVSYPAVKALKQENPEMQLVWLDAHLDLKQKVGDNVSHDAVVRQLVEEDIFRPEEVFFVGVTRIDGDEEKYLEDRDFNLYRSDEVDEFLREFTTGEQPVYLSLDIDALDVEGTGYRDGELSVEEVRKVIDELRVEHADLVEVAPPLDDGATVEAARKLLKHLVEAGTV